MSVALLESLPNSRLKALLEHFAQIEDPREPWRVAHPLPEVLLLVVCGTIAECDAYDDIAAWDEFRPHADFCTNVSAGGPVLGRIEGGILAACGGRIGEADEVMR